MQIPVLGAAPVRQIWLGFDPAFEKASHEHYWREDVCAFRIASMDGMDL